MLGQVLDTHLTRLGEHVDNGAAALLGVAFVHDPLQTTSFDLKDILVDRKGNARFFAGRRG